MLESVFITALYAAQISPLEDSVLYKAAYSAVSQSRRYKADRFRFEKDRQRCIGAELLLRCALRSNGIADFDIDFVYGAQGKPYLRNSGPYFNISHSGDWVICAVSDFETGCDVEKSMTADLKLAKRFFCVEEYNDIAAQPTPQEQSDLFSRYWVLKESFQKAAGLGMKLPFNAFRIVRGSEITVLHTVDERSYCFREFQDLTGYKCALCTAGDCRDAELRIIDFCEFL